MSVTTRLSSKGQIVIPKEIRDALCLMPGETLSISRKGRKIILEAGDEPHERISYAEFKRMVPAYVGPPVSVEQMDNLDSLFDDWRV